MTAWLLALGVLASPRFEVVRPCDDIEPLRWETWLYRDGGEGLFEHEAFLPETEWRAGAQDVTGARLVADCFGVGDPHSRDVLVHHYPPAPLTPPRVRPVLLVPGAGDNALRSLSFLAVTLSRAGFHAYALTFAHRHGDNFQQAEHVANALGVISAAHPGVRVDVVAYSKGGLAARIYASNAPGIEWPHAGYEAHSTRYRGDIGRLVLLGAANAGVDTIFRWPTANLLSVGATPPDAPTSWTRYWGGGVPVDLTARNISAADHFPGQSQLIADLRGLHTLPGGNAAFGLYGNQPDYLTTYVGGLGFVSESLGIEHAIDAGLRTMEVVQRNGVDPSVELYLVAGGNPISSVGSLGDGLYQAWWGDADATARRQAWEALVAAALDDLFPWWSEAFADDLPRLFAGTAFLGEVSGASDGLVFVDSALDESGVTSAGARVIESHLFTGLNHAELVAAGQLAADFYGDAELAGPLHDPALAAKYGRAENQIVEWLRGVLEGPVPEVPPTPADAGCPRCTDATVDAAADGGPDATDDTGPPPSRASQDRGSAATVGRSPRESASAAPARPPPPGAPGSGSCSGCGGGSGGRAVVLDDQPRLRLRRRSRGLAPRRRAGSLDGRGLGALLDGRRGGDHPDLRHVDVRGVGHLDHRGRHDKA